MHQLSNNHRFSDRMTSYSLHTIDFYFTYSLLQFRLMIQDGYSPVGPRIVYFNLILKHKVRKLPNIVELRFGYQ